jgi:23S rRNA pseudouridine1911/1915/1917 synthase
LRAKFHYTVPHKFSGITVQQSILACFPFREPESLLALLDPSTLLVNAQNVSLKSILNAGDELQYSLNNYHEPEVNTQWHLLWQNDEIIAVHKPANLPVSRTTRNIYNTLVQLVRRESQWPDAHLLHRLDLETSGIVLLAKNKQLASKWQPKISQLMQRKIYHAVVYGVPTWQTKSLECTLAQIPESPIRCQMHIAEPGVPGKHSHTQFKVLRKMASYSVIECELFTGRKHQIRAHLSHLGHPIVGDKVYAHEGSYFLKRINNVLTLEDEEMIATTHHLLCAYQLTLQLDANSGTEIVVDNNYPDAWQNFINLHR